MLWPCSDLAYLTKYASYVGALCAGIALLYQSIMGPLFIATLTQYPLPRDELHDTIDALIHVVLGIILSGFAGFIVTLVLLTIVWIYCTLR